MEKEQWKAVKGYESYYEISNIGNIKSVDRIVMSGGFERRRKGRALKPHVNRYGYLMVDLSVDGKQKKRSIHSLVAEVFLEGIGEVINHKDGNKLNNHHSNLEKISALENMKHAVENGLIPRGESNHNAKITARTALEIKCLIRKGEITQTDIAKLFEVNRSIVKCIKLGRTWKHV